MRLFNTKIKTGTLEIIWWVIVFVLNFLSNLQYDPPPKAACFAILTILFYAAILYGNANWLIPRFYNRKKIAVYVLLVLMLLAITLLLRGIAAVYIANAYSAIKKGKLTMSTVWYSTFMAIWIFLVSILYRLTMDYFALSKKQGEIKAEKAQTELYLLKQQIHPHFLFNTLNNIYYVAQKDSPDAADLIERLSGIIRYFIEESKKDVVSLKDEIDLLKSYIELESIRMRYEMPIEFLIKDNIDKIIIPPLLLLPLVENIFKHGVDKRSSNNFAEISLTVTDDHLLFSTRNRYFPPVETNSNSKTGLANLEKRLILYYQHNYLLNTIQRDNIFTASLQIPVYEN